MGACESVCNKVPCCRGKDEDEGGYSGGGGNNNFVSNSTGSNSNSSNIYGGSKQNLPSGGQFTDNLFPPGKNLLCEYSGGSYSYPSSLSKNVGSLQKWMKDGVEFQRAETIFGSPNFKVFEDGIEAADIQQGSLGDCYFLSAVAALANTPKLVENLFTEKGKSNNSGYGVNMRVNGIWKTVYLDDNFPCVKRGNKYDFHFSRANGNELWVLLLEKAWAKICGSYFRIIGGNSGEVFDALSNGYTEYIKFQDEITNTDNTELIWKKIIEGTKNNYLMGASSYESNNADINGYGVDNEGIVPGHAYSLLKARETKIEGKVLRLVQLRNPWGKTEWKGAWSDDDGNWDKYGLRKEFGVGVKDEGEFWIDFQNFKRKYVAVTVCHIHNGYSYSVSEVSKQQASERPAIFKLDVPSSCHCYVMQHNRSPRIKCEDGRYSEEVRAHFLIMDQNYNYIGAANYGHYYFGTEVNFPRGGTYYVIADANYRYLYGSAGTYGYNISTYSSKKIKISLDNSHDIEKAFKTCIYNYCKSGQVHGKSTADNLMTYSNKDGNENEFGFSFALYENKGSSEYELNIQISAQNGISFYFEEESNQSSKITRKLLPNQWEVIAMIAHGYGTSGYQTGMKYHKYTGPKPPSGCPTLSGKKY